MYYQTWQSQGIKDYSFILKIYLAGSYLWEGFGGFHWHEKPILSLRISVIDNEVVSVIDDETGSQINAPQYENCMTIPELFTFIREVLDHINTEELFFKAGTYLEYDYFLPKTHFYSDSIMLATPNILVIFNEKYGYPDKISVYIHDGNLEMYSIDYLIQYEVIDFNPL